MVPCCGAVRYYAEYTRTKWKGRLSSKKNQTPKTNKQKNLKPNKQQTWLFHGLELPLCINNFFSLLAFHPPFPLFSCVLISDIFTIWCVLSVLIETIRFGKKMEFQTCVEGHNLITVLALYSLAGASVPMLWNKQSAGSMKYRTLPV